MNTDLQVGFQRYLEKKENEKKVQKDDIFDIDISRRDDDISVFSNSSEFKQYLYEEKGADVSIFSKSMNEIMEMQMIDGKLVDVSEDFEDDFETDENQSLGDIIAQEEELASNQDQALEGTFESPDTIDSNSNVFTDNAPIENKTEALDETPSAKKSYKKEYSDEVKGLLNTLYENKTAIKALDTDGDGVLSDEEKAKFETFAKNYDPKSKELSEDALRGAFKDISEGNFSYDKNPRFKLSNSAKEAREKEKAEKKETETAKPKETGSASSAGGGGAVSGAGGGAGYSVGAAAQNLASALSEQVQGETVEQLEQQKTDIQNNELNPAKDELAKVFSGDNEAISSAQEELDKAQEAYDKAVEEDDEISDELKQRREENLEAIQTEETGITNTQEMIAEYDGQIFDLNSSIAASVSNVSALEASLSALSTQTSDKEEKQNEINAKKAEVEKQLASAKEELAKQKEQLAEVEENKATQEEILAEKQEKLAELEKERAEIEEEIAQNCSEETKEAMEAFDKAKDNLQQVKETETEKAQSNVEKAQQKITELDAKINEKRAQETQEKNKVNDYDFDFEDALSEGQKGDLELFKANFEANKDQYQKVADATGVPAELIAAIHWREGSGNFGTYLHNGQPLGQTTTLVPAGIYFEDWTEAAIDAINRQNPELAQDGSLEGCFEFAERYNGLGYRNKGVASPYVWAGTSNYHGGKYVADGQYSAGTWDQQLGVAAMMKALMA